MSDNESPSLGAGRLTRIPPNLRGMAWMCGTVICLSLMAISGRELAQTYNTYQIMFARNVVGIVFIMSVLLYQGPLRVRTRRIGIHIVRNLFHFAAVAGWFYGITILPLAEVFILELTLPIWALIMAAPILGERLTPARITAVAMGFLGILIVLRPGIAIIDPVALIVVLSAIGFAAANITTKFLTRSESALTIVFWMYLLQLIMSIAPAMPGMTFPEPALWPWVIAVGLTAIAAHYCAARGLTLADSGVVIPMHFLRVPLIALLAWLLYDEIVDIWLWAGAAVIFAGTMVNVRAEGKR